jgi:predicted Zn finger-like uncharacterized protein
MIIECPECQKRFVVPSTVFQKGGRKMRCGGCRHEWFEEPKQDTPAFDDLVRAVPPQRNDNTEPGFSNFLKQGKAVILSVALVIVVLYLAFHFMSKPLIIGEGLAFDSVMLEPAEEGGYILNGQIINTMDNVRGVPTIKLTMLLNDEIEGDSILIDPAETSLESGAIMDFVHKIEEISEDTQAIKVTFNNQDY